jgi:hypothetical protein
MAADGVAGMLLMTEPEVRYFTGFHTLFWQSPTRPWFLFVPADGKPIAVIPEIGAPLMRRGWLDDLRTWSAPAPDDDGIGLLAIIVTLTGTGRLAMPMTRHCGHMMCCGARPRLASRRRAPAIAAVICLSPCRR